MRPFWVLLLLCVFTIGSAGAAYAQGEIDARGEKSVSAAALFITYGTTFAVQLYDVRTTSNAVSAGALELNPLVAPFTAGPGMVVAGLARATAISLAVRSIAKRNKMAAIVVGAGVNSAYLAVAVHNNAVAAAMRAQQPPR